MKTNTTIESRSKTMDSVNVAAVALESARTRLNAAKSELGQARKAVNKAAETYTEARTRLLKLVPEAPAYIDPIDGETDES